MRKLIITNIVSLDAYYEGRAATSWRFRWTARSTPTAPSAWGRPTLSCSGATRLACSPASGRPWPTTRTRRPSSARSPAGTTRSRRSISDSLTAEDTGAWRDTTRIVARADAHAAVAELKDGPGGDILVFASRVMWNDLLAADLVDEVHLVVGGVVLGGGTPSFSQGTTPKLELLDTRTFDGSDNTILRYTVVKS